MKDRRQIHLWTEVILSDKNTQRRELEDLMAQEPEGNLYGKTERARHQPASMLRLEIAPKETTNNLSGLMKSRLG
jgi:hypothetical protein